MINVNNLYKLKEQGLITIRPNEDNTLFIANYTSKVQYDKLWTDEIKQCRGLIFKSDGTIIARPFPKFFNLEEHQPEEIPNEPFEVYEKLDGSLGILYFHKGHPKIATRGSFESEQAIKANQLLQKYEIIWNPNLTYLFEIIYPANRVVINYGKEEELVLLAVFDIYSGNEKDITYIDFPYKVKKYDGIKDLSTIKDLQEDNKEGFVIKFTSGMRVKVKFDEYVRLHRILTQVSNKSIWEYLKDGDQDLNEILDRVPDEFYNYVKKIKEDLLAQFSDIEIRAIDCFISRPVDIIRSGNRKEFALWAQTQKYPTLLFNILDEKKLAPAIWKMIKPKYEKPFKEDI